MKIFRMLSKQTQITFVIEIRQERQLVFVCISSIYSLLLKLSVNHLIIIQFENVGFFVV